MSPIRIKNPIIAGNYPDPSICRVGDDYYIACSSFEMYPGIPVFHSRNLADWEKIGYALSRENGFYVSNNACVSGIMAPTLRYHNGLFYIIDANFSDAGNFIITAENPAGPWSQPHWLTDVPGIDASIFFDHDGKCYVAGTGEVWENGSGEKERGIWAAEYDIDNFRMAGEPAVIWNSALRGAASPEAPHLYHIGDYYYLVIAEGGTEHYHSVAVARSREVLGWYEGNPANPVLTHRQFGLDYPVTNIGHADLVQTPDERWYAVMLGSRQIGGRHKNLGRETFFCPVDWEEGWPLFSKLTGKVEPEYEIPDFTGGSCQPDASASGKKTGEKAENVLFGIKTGLSPDCLFWGSPGEHFYDIAGDGLHLKCLKRSLLHELESERPGAEKNFDRTIAMLGCWQTDRCFTLSCVMKFDPENEETAGLALVQAMNHQIRMEVFAAGENKKVRIVMNTSSYQVPTYAPGFSYHMHEKILAEADITGQERICLLIKADGQRISFYVGEKEEELTCLAADADCGALAPDYLGNMTGTVLSAFASANGGESGNEAVFEKISVIQGQHCA